MWDTNFVPKNVESEDNGWRTETLFRVGKWIMVIYKDGQTRGSIELFEKDELEKWKKITQDLNELPK